jgi:putative hydrolase of the HAD superfamily
MFDIEKVKGIIFDYGGTIDTNGLHWSEVIWQAYQALEIPVGKETFREAYKVGERTLAQDLRVKPIHNFWHVLRLKAEVQTQWLFDNGYLLDAGQLPRYVSGIADWCYAYAQTATNTARPILKKLSERYPLILVSNFYGNIVYVLEDFHMKELFSSIVESAVVGVRKPDPEIFRLGVGQTGFRTEEVVVIGDSYDKDIAPATALGCHTIWLKKAGWAAYKGDETADVVITDFAQLKDIFKL